MGESSCSAEEYVAGEDTIPVCADFDYEDWDENWLNSLNVDNGLFQLIKIHPC